MNQNPLIQEQLDRYSSYSFKYNIRPSLEMSEDPAILSAQIDQIIAADETAYQADQALIPAIQARYDADQFNGPKADFPTDFVRSEYANKFVDDAIEADRVYPLRNRIQAMQSQDSGMPGFYRLITNCSNSALFLNNLLKPESAAKVESILAEIEASSTAYFANPEAKVEQKYRLVGEELELIPQSEIDAKYQDLDFIRQELAAIRSKRDQLISACDWVMMTDSNATDDCILAYKEYRQALRNLPSGLTDLRQLVWPVKPAYASKE